MQKRNIFTLVAFIAIFFSASAQNNANIKPIKIGQKVPEIVFKNVLLFKSRQLKLSDFKGKLVILDLWATWCSSCIDRFAHMEQLQKQYDGKMQILLANGYTTKTETEAAIKQTLAVYKDRTGFLPTLPMPILEGVLNKYFPHKFVPRLIWINKDGVYLGMSDPDDLNEKNIALALAGKTNLFVNKKDFEFDRNKPFLINGNGGPDSAFVSRSVLTLERPELGVFYIGKNAEDKQFGLTIINYGMDFLVAIAYQELVEIGLEKGLGKNRYIYDYTNKNLLNGKFCYDITVPPLARTETTIGRFLKEDLYRTFNITAKIEKRTIKVSVLGKPETISPFLTKAIKQQDDLDPYSKKKFMHGYTVDEILRLLNIYLPRPLLNETGMQEKIDIDFPDDIDLKDNDAMIAFFKKIGFPVSIEDRELEVFVVTDK